MEVVNKIKKSLEKIVAVSILGGAIFFGGCYTAFDVKRNKMVVNNETYYVSKFVDLSGSSDPHSHFKVELNKEGREYQFYYMKDVTGDDPLNLVKGEKVPFLTSLYLFSRALDESLPPEERKGKIIKKDSKEIYAQFFKLENQESRIEANLTYITEENGKFYLFILKMPKYLEKEDFEIVKKEDDNVYFRLKTPSTRKESLDEVADLFVRLIDNHKKIIEQEEKIKQGG